VLLLEHGRIVNEGKPAKVLYDYLLQVFPPESKVGVRL
jgi:hypothetical protein